MIPANVKGVIGHTQKTQTPHVICKVKKMHNSRVICKVQGKNIYDMGSLQ